VANGNRVSRRICPRRTGANRRRFAEPKKGLRPHKTKSDAIYKPIRDQIADIILRDERLIADLYSRTQKTDVDEILLFLHGLIKAIWEMAFNAARPNLSGDNYG
jgi:hypothetical protein